MSAIRTRALAIAVGAAFFAASDAGAQIWTPILQEDFGTGTEDVSTNPAAQLAPGTTDYTVRTVTPVSDGEYAVTKNPDFVDDFGGGPNQWQHAGDHTSGTGYMALFNANPSRTGETNGSYYIYGTSTADIPGATYRARYWAANAIRYNAGAAYFDGYIRFSVRDSSSGAGTQYAQDTVASPEGVLPRAVNDQNNLPWVQRTAQFTLPLNYTSPTLYFNFYNSAPPGVTTSGNDLVIDDLLVERADANLQGRVYLDNNANGIQDAGEAAFPQPYYVASVGVSGKVVDAAAINASGDFVLPAALWSSADVGQRLILSATLPAIGSTLAGASFPAGYQLVSETPPATYGSRGTNPTDGIENVIRTDTPTSTVTGFNFGLRKLPILRLQKSLPLGRFVGTDQFALSIVGSGGPAGATTTGSSNAPGDVATLNPGAVGASYAFAETAAAGANLANYLTAYACTNALAGGQAPSGSGTTFAVTAVAGDDLTCTFTNTRNPISDLTITKTNSSTPATQPNDQSGDTVVRGANTTYTIMVTNNGPDTVTGAVLRDTSAGRAGLTCAAPPTCTGSACPAGLSLAQLETGASLGAMANGASITVTLTCVVN
ncbi:DUF11 domain-containing protein [Lysobacter sp. BMK333-48F3]|uniref:prealbumin-like fold domain-containing protein n=1 Tax=Lysobacter sp. BMK333-48F3 TaxID=2867962 RepID=UPI001C8C7403|nr:DUF11 domain-containing protein [Lysobacter sp. BMK333-48F3]MBX9400233.1 DUF11 domain-containing protein [Lysobacter sp. BMK333-48F3]